MVKPSLKQLRGSTPLRKSIGKHHAPRPGVARQRFLRLNHPGRTALEIENMSLVPVP